MATLYLDKRDSELRHKGQALMVYSGGTHLNTVPMNLLERVVVHGSVATDSATLGALADADVAVVMLTGRHGRRQASLLGGLHGDARRRVAQYRAYADVSFRTELGACFLRRKLQGQRRVLVQALRRRPDKRYSLSRSIATLDQLRSRVDGEHQVLASLRGIEGAAAAAYFGAYQTLFPPELCFKGRRRRPPPDPVNAALSLGYTLLHAEAVQIVFGAGLDPYLGYLHEPVHGRESLAADLIEPIRPRLDLWVWHQFRARELRADHFRKADGGCLLGKAGRAHFYAAYDGFASPLRRWMRRFTHALIERLGAAAPVGEMFE